MPCYHPLKGFIIGTNPATGNKKIMVKSYKVDHLELRSDGKFYEVFDSRRTPFAKVFNKFDDIPCGQCIGCRLAHSKQWADRASLELQYHDYNYFITLTYDPYHVPTRICQTDEDGVVTMESLTLKKKDLQNFWKNLRSALGDIKIRYLACGEYGNDARPHYHAIVFGLPLSDLQFWKKTEIGDDIWRSPFLEKIWKKGMVFVGEANWNSIAYVSRYVTKKLNGSEAQVYEQYNIDPEFLVCSRKPGIGRQYYEDHKEDLFNKSKFFIPSRDGVRAACPSRYFSSLFDIDYGSELNDARKKYLKSVFSASKTIKEQISCKSYLEMLEDEEYNKLKQIESLKRK